LFLSEKLFAEDKRSELLGNIKGNFCISFENAYTGGGENIVQQ
jgi:hypothetical protein